MKNYTKTLLLLLVIFLTAFVSYYTGRQTEKTTNQEEIENLYYLNRSELEKVKLSEGPIYVIGHKSPDSDTVCSAIAYADILNQLGIEAVARITEKPNNETAYILEFAGAETPEILYDASGLNIFLVDHSEYAQAVDNLEDANIIGIIDHHGIGTVSTGQQVIYNDKPIGATATILYMTYRNYGLKIEKQIAQLLLGAILSDTSNLSGSTTIEADRIALEDLVKIAEVDDVNSLYEKIHERKLSYDGFSDEEILFSDYKEYESSGVKYGIGLANALDEKTAEQLASRMAKTLPESINSVDVDLLYVSIRAEDNKIDYIVPGNELSESILKSAFPDYEYDGVSYIYKSGLGRKTKFVPGLNDYLAAHPHE